MNLTFTYPSWYLLLCLLLGVIASFVLYYRDWQFKDLGQSFKKWLWVLAIIRAVAISFIAFLLLSPLVRTLSTHIEKPILIFAQDNSSSVMVNQNKEDSLQYQQEATQFINDLSKDYEVKSYSFGSSLREDPDFTFSDKTTNISAALEEIDNLYTNQNLGAIILATDGIYNEGSNPVYLKGALNVPVYTVGMGDTTVKRDLQLLSVIHNRTVFLGDYFPLKAEWRSQFCSGEKTSVTVSLIAGGVANKLDEKAISLEGNDFSGSTEFLLKAATPGVNHYRITLAKVEGEASEINNIKDVFIEVMEKKEKILILANTPHPDVAAIKQSIEANKNYEVTIAFGATVPGKIEDYNLVILHQLPSSANGIQPLIQSIRAKKKSLLFILGAQTNGALLNVSQTLVNLAGANGSTSDAFPVLSKEFTLFNIPDDLKNKLASWPPLIAPFGDYRVSSGAATLMVQKIGSVVTKFPLILFQQDLDGRTGIIAGEGLWRWRINDYEQTGNHEAFNALLSSVVQYLSVKADERQFRVRLEKEQKAGSNHIFSENESVIFSGELLNESNELINTPDVSLTIKDEQGKEFPFVFSKSMNAYTLNAGYFPVGNYTYNAKVNYNKKDFYAAGTFTVSPTQLEFETTRANHQLLYSLSQKTGGKLYYPSQWNDLAAEIRAKQDIKPVLYSSTRTEPLINLRWLIIPILLLLALEWGIRKFNGGY
ncbi:MAG TPA: hypothetical protein PLD84_03405 [Chitinophagales bacterium]|nr:hypothetical protein [Chitinophagales bacterium]